jgi:hypothetical protein
MRTSITIGYIRGTGITELLAAGETSIEEQRQQFKEARQIRFHDKYERVERWESDRGRIQYHYFEAPPVEGEVAAQPPSAPSTPPAQTPDEPSEPTTQDAPATPPPVEGEVAAEQPDGEDTEDFEVKTKAVDDESEADGDKPKAKGSKKRK